MRTKSKFFATAMVAAVAAAVNAEMTLWYYVGGSNEWDKVASYTTNSKATAPDGNTVWPDDDDRIMVKNNQRLFADDSTIQYLNAVASVYFNCTGAKFTITLQNDAVLTCAFGDIGAHGESYINVLEKNGPGTLALTSMAGTGANVYTYNIGLDVVQGTLKMGPTSSSSGSGARYFYGDVTVRNGATVCCVTNGSTLVYSIAGGGVLTNESPTVSTSGPWLNVCGTKGAPTEFSGRIAGKQYVIITHSTYLTGDASTFNVLRPSGYKETNVDMNTGVIGFKTLGGTRDGASSFGTAMPDFRNGSAWILFLGNTGEVVERDFNLQKTTAAPIVIDAGAYGGLEFSANSYFKNVDNANQQRLVLTGSNSVPCVLNNPWHSSFYVTKRGSGTWRFAARSSNNFSGVLAVEDGTVEFASIAETNKACSLGYASSLYEDKCDALGSLVMVDYAYLMGADGTCGMLDYIGDNSAICSTRRIAVKGEGGLSTSAGLLKWCDIRGAGSGEKSLVVGGANTAENTVVDIVDGPDGGTLSVVKKGVGDWTLTGKLGFSGDVSVRGGSLTLRNVANPAFKWFRLVLKENVFSSSAYPDVTPGNNYYKYYFWIVEFALYDADGVRRNVFAYPDCMTNDAIAMVAGQVSDAGKAYSDDAKMKFGAMFNDTYAAPNRCAHIRRSDNTEARLSDTNSWINIDCRIADESPTITHYDLNTIYKPGGDYFGCSPAAYEVQASADGIHWERVGGQDAVSYEGMEVATAWMSDFTALVSGEVRKNKGFALTHTTASRECGGLSSVRSVEVAEGATLKLVGAPVSVGQLHVDATGAGLLEGPFAFGASGTLNVENLPNDAVVELPGTYVGVSGLGNLNAWNLALDGSSCTSHNISVKNGKIRIFKRGFLMFVY